MPLVIEMQGKLLFAYGVRNRMFSFGIGYFYVDMTSSIFSKKEDFLRVSDCEELVAEDFIIIVCELFALIQYLRIMIFFSSHCLEFINA